jgi:ADP-ribosylglycohydrolase
MEDVYSAEDAPGVADPAGAPPRSEGAPGEEPARVHYSPDDEFLYYSEEWQGRSGPAMVELMESGRLPLQDGENAFLYTERPALPASLEWDRVEGMMLGLAIGDALGKGSEGLIPGLRGEQHGEIRDYMRLDRPGMGDGRGYPSDDTQMAFWTLEQMIADGGFDPERVARSFCSGRIFGIGQTVTAFIRAFKDGGKPWHQAGQPSAGNGALMRIAPMVIPHLRSTSPDLWADTVLSTAITHNDPAAIASSVAFVNVLWRLLGRTSPPEPEWWLDSFVWVARDLDGREEYGGAGRWASYRGRFSEYVDERVREAYRQGLSAVEACDSWHSGAYLMETVPSALYILMRHGADPEEAIVRAVNDTVDNDTVGAIVGAAVGALHGRSALPARWVANLSGRTRESDDGQVFRLLEEARGLWGAGDRPGA